MITRMISQSWRRNPRQKLLTVLTVFLAASLLSALMTVSIDIGDKMAREMKSYGANILIEPAEQAAMPALMGDDDNPLAVKSTLDEKDLPAIMGIFWRNNILGFAPLLDGKIQLDGHNVHLIGTFFDQNIPVPDEPEYRTGQKTISPYWQVTGTWPDDTKPELLAGAQLAKQNNWQPGTNLTISGQAVTITGILSSGSDEENAIIAPLKLAQQWLGLEGKVHAAKVSALTVPENELSKKAIQNPDALDAETYDRWYCTAYVSSISHQLEESIPGIVARPIWQVAASEGVIIDKIQWLLVMATLAALLAAAMGVASLMTSIFMERSKEIGLMKALGAHNWMIGLLFYAEAVLSSLIGGLVGCLAGWSIAQFIGWQLFGEPLQFSWIVVPSVLVISIIIAVIGTWFPARRITRLYPVEALYGRS
ncbi:ABC transporter permease [Microvirga sp. W0021]|uniref:ABC transporter permease n=1 Tax=Hohaiivirga grylli TaxID=3133970 RepID=A0ABV0BLB1_9HYPH